MADFTSYKFQQLFMNGTIPVGCSIESFVVTTENYENLYDSIEKIIKFFNENGRWTVIGWSRRGEISDLSPENSSASTSEKVEASEVTHHFVRVFPTFLNSLSTRNLDDYKKEQYDVSSLTEA